MKYLIPYRTWTFDVVSGFKRDVLEFEATNDDEAKERMEQFRKELQEQVQWSILKSFYLDKLICLESDGDRIIINNLSCP